MKDWFSLASLAPLSRPLTRSSAQGRASPLPREVATPAEPASAAHNSIDFDGIGDRIVPCPPAALPCGACNRQSGELYYL